jgi:hypothetical protein
MISPKRERDDADVVASQAQRGHADQHAGGRRRDDREHEDDQEVQMDAGAAAGVGPERRSEVRGHVRADREERHVPQVEQPGEAHDGVQAQRHDHVRRRQDHVVQRAAALADEERQDGGEAEARGGQHAPRAHPSDVLRRR